MSVDENSIEQYFHVVLNINYAVQGGCNFYWNVCRWNPSVKAIEQYFHVVLFIKLYKMFLTFMFVDETL